MPPLKAHVKNGRLVLDDPTTDLPEGSEVELVVVDDEFDLSLIHISEPTRPY